MTEKPTPSVRTSGGNPNGLPNYRPINKLPEHEIRQLLRKTIRPALYQVRVESVAEGDHAVGPKCPHDTALAFATAVQREILAGREKVWSNPRVVLTL